MIRTKYRFDIGSLIMINASVYALLGLYYSFIQIYLAKTHNAVEVGSLLSFGQVVATFAPLFWGLMADKSRYKNTVIAIACAGSIFFYIAVTFSNNIWWLAFALGGTMWFLSSLGGLVDTVSLEYSSENNIKYGHLRIFGTLSYGLISFVLSLFIKNDLRLIFYMYAAVGVLAVVSLLFSPKVEGHAKNKEKFNLKPLFCDRNLMFMFLFMGVAHFAWGYYLNFFPTYLSNELLAPDWVWGLNVLFTVLGEIPFFLMFNKLFERFGIRRIFMAAIILTVVRYALLAVFTGYYIIMVAGAVTGFGISLFGYCCAVYINSNVAPGLKASAQTLMYSLAVGVPRIISGVAGGFMTEWAGTRISLLVFSAMAFISLALFIIVFKKSKSSI